nr:serine/threonine-protein kinase D6PKL2-like [Ipomoea batatas]
MISSRSGGPHSPPKQPFTVQPPPPQTTMDSPKLDNDQETTRSDSSVTTVEAMGTATYAASSTKPHATSRDPYWTAMCGVLSETAALSLDDFRFIRKLGGGDIGTVYLAELKGSNGCLFAAKVMDKEELVSRNKESRARTEMEILRRLDHPFLPTLYTTLDCDQWLCLVMEFCPGRDLHVLRQLQPEKRFDDAAVRFYASEVVVALEYLHMMGIIYRDLKPENVLVRSDGHIMLTDFDLSLKCDDSKSIPQLVHDQTSPAMDRRSGDRRAKSSAFFKSTCILPYCAAPPHAPCFRLRQKRRRRRAGQRKAPVVVAEPIDMRSMSFVGTHEYLAPEVVTGEGHGNAVDWWTLGIFIYELLYGTTPFRGLEDDFTLSNIVARCLDFPKDPVVPGAAKDLITKLLIKDPTQRMGSTMGATSIKQHPFFDGVNWALLRCASPPYIPDPKPFNHKESVSSSDLDASIEYY